MFTDEEGMEDDGAGGQTRYPVMPSLVALQQMKNRLHLAFLGKKLMKWTAMATSKELRKLAAEINLAFENYGAEFSKAFMLLARCRYYHPDMNAIVVHNVSKQAASVVQFDYRSVAGVKVLELGLIEKGFDPNEHLGIAKGGSTIQETKQCWRELLRLVVLMLQQRTAFRMLYDANKSATKKQNVLAKLVIPKIQKAIAYINAELEEREREETFRLKRFKEKKDKKALKTKEVIKLDEEPYVEAEPDIIVEKPPQKSCACAMANPNQFTDEDGNFDCPICKLADKNVAIKIAPCTLCLPAVKEAEHRLKHLMAHVNQVLLLSKQYLLAETAPCCKEDDNENEGGELNYAGLKKQLEFISVTCTCPHKEPSIQSDGSCTCKPPCQCDEPPKFKDCCGGPEKADVTRSGSEFQTYNLCSIYGSSSCPQSMATGSNFRNSSKNYPAVPPFFYLYSGPYVRSETGFHSIQSKSAKTSKKGLDAAPCKNELTQVKPPCPCAPMDEKKICSCEALSPQQSEQPCVCNSTEILPTQNPPSRQSEAVGGKATCPSCQVVASLHAPKPATDLAKRITRLSEPCLKIKFSVSGYLPVTKSVDPETTKESENSLKPDTRFNPIKRANANLEVTTSSLKQLVDDNKMQTKTCSCKSMEASSEIISQQSSEDLCSCASTDTLVPIVLQSSIDHYNTLLSQSDVVEMICKGIFQTDQPATSLPPPTLSIELAERVAKASEPYLKKKISLNKAYPVDEIEEVPKYPACYLKSVMSKKSTCSKSTCSCESPEQTNSCSCKSMQSCPCGVSDESSRGTNSSEDLSNTTSGPPYFKRPATFFTAVPQKFTPLISYTQEKNIGPYDCCNMTDTILLRGTSISNDFADQYLTFNPYTRDQNYKNNIFSETSSITGSFNKIFSKQAVYLSPYTREGKPGPCGISEVSYVACPLSNTVSKKSSAYTTYLLKENSAYFPTYTQVGKQALCSHSQVSSMGATLDDIDSLASCMASYTGELKSEYCDISETGSITNEFYAIDSKQCTTSLTYTLAENAVITEIDKTSKSLDATVCKDYSIYMSMNHQKNLPYMVYTQQCNNACGSREATDLPGTVKSKDCSTYVTVIRKRPVPYTREGRPGPCGICEMVYQTYFVISEDCATYVTTVPKKNREEQPCGSLSTITTSSSPCSITYATCSNCDTLLPQKEKFDECSICRIVKLSRQFEDFAPFRQSSEYSDNLTLNNDIDLSDSEIYKICNACNPIPKHIEPYTREGIPGPCGVDEENHSVGNQGHIDIIPYTREEIAKLCGVSETNTIVRSLTNRPYTGEGISGPCGISDTCNIDKCSCNSDTKPIPIAKTCIQERKPGSCKVPDTNNIAGSRCNAVPKCLIDVKPCTREATRPCGFTKINHIEDADSIKVRTDVGGCTRKQKPGPCCGSCCIPETDHHATCISIPKTPPYVGVYQQKRTPRSCCASEPIPNAGVTCIKTPKILPDVGAFKREGKLRPSCLSEPNQNEGAICMKTPRTFPCDEAYTRKGTPGPCCLSETNQNAGATCMNTPKILPDVGAFKREGKLRPSCLSEPNQNAGAIYMKTPRTFPCDEAYTRKGTPGPCCLSETNQNAGAICMNTPKILPNGGAFKREGKLRPSCLSEPNQNADAICMKTPRTFPCDEAYTRKGTPGPCCLPEINLDADATCMRTTKMPMEVGAFTREGTPGPCGLSEANSNAGAMSMKIPRSLPCDKAYTREGAPGPCGVPNKNQIESLNSIRVPETVPGGKVNTQEGTQEGTQELKVTETNKTTETPDSQPTSNDEPNTHEDTREPSSATNKDQVIGFLYNTTLHPSLDFKSNRNVGSVRYTVRKLLSHLRPSTRETTPMPCSIPETSHIAGVNSIRIPETLPGIVENAREGISSETNKITSSGCSEDSQPPSNVELHTREERRGPYGISNKDHIVGYFYNTPLKPSSDFRAYTREDIPDRCGVFRTYSNAGSSYTAREFLSDLGPYTVEKIPRLCGSLETKAGSRYNSVNNPIPNVNPFAQDEHPGGPCCISDTDYIASSRWMTAPKVPSNIEQYMRQGISVSNGNSETNDITDFFFNTSPESFGETRSYKRETTPGSPDVFDTDHIAGADSIMVSQPPSAIGPYKREETSGSRDIAKSNGVTGSMRNMIPKFFSRPYTEEGILGPCGVSEKGYNLRSRANSIPKGSTNIKPYTRENQPGPCGISYEASNSSFSVTSSSNRVLENKSSRWNNSRIYKNGTSQLCKLESYTRQENRGPYCETQSCMMCLTTPCTLEGLTRHTGNHNTKDAVTYVTLVPRLVSCTREAVPGSCSTCKTKNTHQAESSKSSAYSCKARVPHIRINDTRSLHSIFPTSCSSCKPPATASEATSMLLPSYILAIPSSTKTSGTCCCKSSRLSTATLGCGPSYNESERYIAPKKGCSICGRSASKLNTHMMSVSYLTSISHGNSDTVGSSSLKSQPCSGCGKATLVMSCASNPSVKSVAIGTCETYFASSKRNPIPKLSTKSSHCHFGKTKAIQQCCNKDVQNSSSEESTTSSESENCASEDCKTSEKRKEDTGELGFGYFEMAFKKITKICKYKNPDGTVTDEKRIITVETTKKRPQTSEDLDIEEGTSIGGSLENETNSIANNNNCKCKSVRNAKSETVQGNVEIDVCPKIRRCISAQNCKNVKDPIIIVPKSCITNSLLKCPHRPHDSDNDSKCKCDKKSNENARRSFDKSTSASCLSKQQDACTVVRTKNHQSNDSKTKCQGGNVPCLAPTRKICPKRYKCLDDTPKSDCAKLDHKSTTCTCTDEPQDIKSEPKNDSQLEPTEPEDSDGGPKCDFTSRQVQESHDREQQTHPPPNKPEDSEKGPKCDCVTKSESKPTPPVCCKPTPNKPEDSENGPKCDCVKKSESKPTPPVCCRQEDSDTEPKCDCAKARKSFSKATAPICPNSIQVTDSKPADNVVFLVPSGQVCTNSFQVLDNSPKSDCACKSLQKLIAPICVHDTKSGPKCSCAKKATSKPVCPKRLKDSDSSPKHVCPNLQPKPAAVCAKKEHDSKSGLKCKCEKSHRPSDAACNNILQKTDSDIKCEYLNKMLHKSTSPVCALKQQNECTGVCGNPQKDSENEPKFKFEDGNAVLIVPTIKTCTDNCENKSHRKSSTPISTVELHDTKTEKKCSCRKSQSKPTVPVCSNKQHESDSSPKCKCGNKSPPKSTVTVCPNKMNDIGSEPKCACANKTPSKPSPPVCANRLEDSDSGPKCDCPNETPKPTAPGCDHNLDDPNSGGPKCDCAAKTPPKSLPPVCANRLEDSDSGPKCDCPNETPKPTTPECANRIEDTDSGPKCDCANHPSNQVSNNKKNSGCDPMCELASKILPMLVSKGQPENNKVTNRKAKGTEDNFIFLALTGKGCTINPLKPTAPEYANRLEDSDNSSECNCENQSPPKTSNSLCTNKLEDSCECVSKSLPEFNKIICTNCYQVSDSEPKNYEGNNFYVMPTGMTSVSDNDSKSKSLPKLSTPICTTWQQDKTKNCANKSLCKTTTPVCTNKIEDTDSGSKCGCIKKAPKSIVPMCGDRLEDSDIGEKCACMDISPPEPIAPICANRLQNSDSGSKCECADVTPSVKDTETETELDLRNAIETSDNSNKLPAVKLQNDKEAGRVLDLHDVKGDGNREKKTQDKQVSSSPQKVAGVLDLHDENDKDSSEEKLPSAKTQDYKLPAVTSQNEKVAGRVLDLHDVKGDGNREEKTQDKEVSCSPQVEGGRVLDLHNLKDNCDHEEPSTKLQNQEREEGGNKLLLTKTQDRKISCSSLQRETGIVIDLNDLKEIEKEEICTCKNVCKCDKSHSKKPEEAGRVVNLNNCKCKTGLLSATAQIQEIYGILHGIVGKVIDTHGINENRNCESKARSAKRQNKEVCCSLQPEKGIIVDLRDKKDKRNLDKKTHSITCHGGSGMVLNLNNAKDNCENRLNEYTVPSKRTLCKPIQKTDIAMSTTDLHTKPKAICVPTSTKIDSNSCCPVKIIPKPRKICCCTAAHDASKLSIFKRVSMMDALRQLFQHSNSRTQKVQDKNICKTCYSPLSNSDEVECLCDNCKEKLIDENERHYRCTNYSTEPGTPCKSAPSLSHRFCFSKNNFKSNTEDRHCYQSPFAIKTPSMDSDTCLNCAEHDSCCNDVATSTKSRDISYVRIIKKGKIEHGCTKCGTRDGESHSRHKS